MNRTKLSAWIGGVLVLAASSTVHARPVVFEPRDDVTFSMRVTKAVPGLAVSRPGFVLSGASTAHGGDLLFGASHATSPFGSNGTSFDSGDLSVLQSDSNSRAGWNHGAHAHEQVGAVATENMLNDMFAGTHEHEHSLSPVPAIPEPSTYALLAIGLAGIVMLRGSRRPVGR